MFDEQNRQSTPRPDGQGESVLLADATALWMQHLPKHVRPLRTVERFPHIANALAANWQAPDACRAYFDQLLLDQRGNRQGFPKLIATELAALKDHYESVVHPTQQTVWDEIRGHARL